VQDKNTEVIAKCIVHLKFHISSKSNDGLMVKPAITYL